MGWGSGERRAQRQQAEGECILETRDCYVYMTLYYTSELAETVLDDLKIVKIRRIWGLTLLLRTITVGVSRLLRECRPRSTWGGPATPFSSAAAD